MRAGAVLAVAAACLAAGGLLGPLNNYDTAYALLWGSELADGTAPDLEVALAPTPHPLANAYGAVLSLLGTDAAIWLWQGTALLALVALGVLVAALGARWFGVAAGVLAALIVLTREPVLSFGLRAYVDLPYVCLLLGALLSVRRPQRALGLLALAGLLRPEAWLFAAVFGAWLWRHGELRSRHVALVVAAPLLWALHDLVLTGDPLWSLTGTQENADQLQRVTGLDDVPLTTPRRLGEILREPGLLAAAAGVLLALRFRAERARLPLAALGVALGAFVVLAAAGLPLLTRYLILPAALLGIFAGAALAGWAARPEPVWKATAAVCAVVFAAFVPSQVERLDRLGRALDRQATILYDLEDVVERRPCPTVTLANRRAIPQVRLWTGLAADAVRSAQDAPLAGTYVAPASQAVAEDFVLDRRDRDRTIPAPPPGTVVLRTPLWVAADLCSGVR